MGIRIINQLPIAQIHKQYQKSPFRELKTYTQHPQKLKS